MTDSDKNVEEVEEVKEDSVEEVDNTDKTEEYLTRNATEESDVFDSVDRRRGNIVDYDGKLEYAEDALKATSDKTDVNPLDGNEIDKDSQFNPTKGI